MRDILMEKASRKETAILNTTAEHFATDADEARQEVGADVVAFGDFTSTVTVWDKDPAVAEAHLEDVMQIFDARGFVTIRERAVVYLYVADNWSRPVWDCQHCVSKAVTGSHMGG